MRQLNLDALILATAQLERGLAESLQQPSHELMRDGAIQRFEYTMDLAWKMLQRYLRMMQVEESAIRSKNDLFREAARMQIIDDAESWIIHYEARNETSHDYNTAKAEQVYRQAQRFLPDVQRLLKVLQHAN